MRTPFTEMLDLTHPVALAPMAMVTNGGLAAAMAETGGLGLLGAGYGLPAWGGHEWMEREFAAARQKTNAPYLGVGFITWRLAEEPDLLQTALAHKPAAVMLSFGDPVPFADDIKQAGAKLICQVQTIVDAKAAAKAGADVIIAQGTEAGGHGATRATLPFVPAVVDAVGSIPVLAAGGIADGRGLAAALALGAAGALVGTRFFAATESGGPPNAQPRMVAASGEDTRRTSVVDMARGMDWPKPYTGRVIANDYVRRWHGNEEALQGELASEQARFAEAMTQGDFDTAAVHAGEGLDLIHEVQPVRTIVDDMLADARKALAAATAAAES